MKIILFTGLTGSGKSSISQAVAERLGIKRISLKSIVHRMTQERGYSKARTWIAAEGMPTFLKELGSELLKEVQMSRQEKAFIIDDVLDIGTLNLLKQSFPEDEHTIVYIRTNRHARQRFVGKRLQISNKQLIRSEIKTRDFIKEQAGIRDIISNANYRFKNSSTLSNLVDEVSNTLEANFLDNTSSNKVS
jgi:dephospho-CoA kinase